MQVWVVLSVELWATTRGLHLAHHLGFMQVILEMDPLLALQMIEEQVA